MPMLCSPFLIPPRFPADFSGPQYLVTFHTSNSRLRVICMAVGTMTIIPLAHRSSQNSCATVKPTHINIPTPDKIATTSGKMLNAPNSINITAMNEKNTALNTNHIMRPPIFYICLLQFYNPFYLSHSK